MFFRSQYFKGIVLVAIVVTISCAPALYIPEKANVAAGSDLTVLQAGRKLYVSKCGSCHTLILPEKHTGTQWPALVANMEARAKISPEESKLILKYLLKGEDQNK